MCNIVVILRNYTEEKATLFAKNSDREPNEAQIVEYVPRLRHSEEKVRATYIEVPQIDETYAMVLSRPWWSWGAEMGVNEYGVAIGNVAVFTKVPHEKTGLTGMDLVRLGLERGKTAKEALKIMTQLLEEYGQGGNHSRTSKMYYHNSFMIADPNEAYVLETAGKYWVAERVNDVRSISNALTIHNKWDFEGEELRRYLAEKGIGKDAFDFAKNFSDFLYTRVVKGIERQKYTQAFLERNKGNISVWKVMKLMRSHYNEDNYAPVKGSMRDICMHAGGLTRPIQTANSMIAILYEKIPIILTTATSSPCISMYKPVYIESGLPNLGPAPTDKYNPQAYWWIHEKLHRKLLVSYNEYMGRMREEIEELERKLITEAIRLRDEYIRGRATKEDLLNLTKQAFELGLRIDEKYVGIVRKKHSYNPIFEIYWHQINRKAKLLE